MNHELTGPVVSAIVPTCGDVAALQRTLNSIFATGYVPLEVVVVENRPPQPGTRQLVEQHFHDRPVRYVEEPRPGSSRARNAGLMHSKGSIIAFTDDDVIVDERWIKNALKVLDKQRDIACVTGRILPVSLDEPNQRLFADFSVFDKGAIAQVFRLPDTRRELPLFPYIAGHIGSGASIILRREVVEAIGGFDPLLGGGTPAVGGEDLDLFIRLVQAGHAIVYDPTVVVFHDNPSSLGDLRHHAYRYGMGLTAMLTKHLVHGPDRLRLLQAIPAGVRYLRDPASRKNLPRSSTYPRSLKALEYSGMVLGPLAYGASLARSATERQRQIAGGGSPPSRRIAGRQRPDA